MTEPIILPVSAADLRYLPAVPLLSLVALIPAVIGYRKGHDLLLWWACCLFCPVWSIWGALCYGIDFEGRQRHRLAGWRSWLPGALGIVALTAFVTALSYLHVHGLKVVFR